MADLWKDGDVITAQKLNRIIIANATEDTLDITPNDVFDENNIPTSLIIIQSFDDGNDYHVINHIIDSFIGYIDSEYRIVIINPLSSKQICFSASSRNDYFIIKTEENNNEFTPS